MNNFSKFLLAVILILGLSFGCKKTSTKKEIETPLPKVTNEVIESFRSET